MHPLLTPAGDGWSEMEDGSRYCTWVGAMWSWRTGAPPSGEGGMPGLNITPVRGAARSPLDGGGLRRVYWDAPGTSRVWPRCPYMGLDRIGTGLEVVRSGDACPRGTRIVRVSPNFDIHSFASKLIQCIDRHI